MSHILYQPIVGRILVCLVCALVQKVHGESHVEVGRRLDFVHVAFRQLEAERFDVTFEMLQLATSDDGEYVRSLVHYIGQSLDGQSIHTRESRYQGWTYDAGHDCPFAGSDLLQDRGNGQISLGCAERFATLLALTLFFRLEIAAAE